MSNEEQWRARVRELEEEVRAREEDLGTFRKELTAANRKLEALIAELNMEIKVIHEIQRHLQPTEIPNIQGFEFSSKFVPSFIRGGDYFDIFEHEDRSRFGIIVASSSGHVMSALLLSVLLKFTSRMEARRGLEPHALLQAIGQDLKKGIGSHDSADLFYGLFDRRQFSLQFAKIGDVIALHYDYSNNDLKLLKSQGGAFTAESESEIQSQSVQLNPRDKMIFCTKGVVEAKNLEGEEFGYDRLFRAVLESATRGVHEVRNHIIFKVQDFVGGQEWPRDVTVVVSEVKDRVIKLAKK